MTKRVLVNLAHKMFTNTGALLCTQFVDWTQVGGWKRVVHVVREPTVAPRARGKSRIWFWRNAYNKRVGESITTRRRRFVESVDGTCFLLNGRRKVERGAHFLLMAREILRGQILTARPIP
uniref:Uncharacterized protein n=1 Tax=Cacopsylla melanoneura TaxID=428564 RepID=A0A8D8XEH7_9HEMI